MKNFMLYWLDTRDGSGYRAKDYPAAMSFDEAFSIVSKKPKHKQREHFRCELRYEPIELHKKYTINNPAI